MDYKELLEYIYERHSGNVKLGLGRMLSILAGMGNPNEKLSGIHVAGTNGKGSTCAMLEAMSLGAGQKTGLNTSPHLVDYRERIRVDGTNIAIEDLVRIYRQWESLFKNQEASFFEITTAMAFYYFWEQQVETAIFEVGLGGRLDGTNPFAAQIAVITSISFDHIKSLGNSLPKIAWEKAGIIKGGQEVVLGDIPQTAYEVISRICASRGAKLSRLGSSFEVKNIKLSEQGTQFDYSDEDVTWKGMCVNLMGEHQAFNAAVAIRSFRKWMQSRGQIIDEAQLRQNLQKTRWGGRMQILHTSPTVVIDGAHNEEGIRKLVLNVREIFKNKRIIFVLAILRDKKLESMIKEISRVADYLIISKNKSKRAAEIADQVEYAEKYRIDYITAIDVVTATRRALAKAEADDVIIITGSLYTISEVLAEKMFVEN